MYGRKQYISPSANGEELAPTRQAKLKGAMNTAARCSARSALIAPRANGDRAAARAGVPEEDSDFELAALRVVMLSVIDPQHGRRQRIRTQAMLAVKKRKSPRNGITGARANDRRPHYLTLSQRERG